jgi:hypothetical protein
MSKHETTALTAVMGILGAITFIVLISIYSMFVSAFVISYLWVWFLVPLGLKSLVFWHYAGISLIVGYLTHQADGDKIKEEYKEDGYSKIVMALIKPWLILLFGYIISRAL